MPPPDPFHAFLAYEGPPVPHAASGPLAGLTLAVKDLFDVEGYPTGCGNPIKLSQSRPAAVHAPAVARMLDAGADFIGKTQTDELAFSLNGQNMHFPQPINPRCPDRITGGSSSGSAAAVAGALVDLAIGSDTGGSVRAPASYCGLFGIRPTHGRVPLDGTMPLAPSFDVPGYFAATADVFGRAAEPFLGADTSHFKPTRLLMAQDAFMLGVAGLDRAALERSIDSNPVNVAPEGFDSLYWAFRRLQAREAWGAHGAWIETHDPQMTPGVRDRFTFGRDVGPDEAIEAETIRRVFRERFDALLDEDAVLVLPTVPGAAPRNDADFETLQAYREKALRLLCLSGLSGLPQVTLPWGEAEGCPVGLSLIGPRGRDVGLVGFALDLLGGRLGYG